MKVHSIQQNQSFKGRVSANLEANIRTAAKNNIAEIVEKANQGGVRVDENVIKQMKAYADKLVLKFKNYMLFFHEDIVLNQNNLASSVDFVHSPQKSNITNYLHISGTQSKSLDGKCFGHFVELNGVVSLLSEYKYVQEYDTLLNKLVEKIKPNIVEKRFLKYFEDSLEDLANHSDTKLSSQTPLIKRIKEKLFGSNDTYLDKEIEVYKNFAKDIGMEYKFNINTTVNNIMQIYKKNSTKIEARNSKTLK